MKKLVICWLLVALLASCLQDKTYRGVIVDKGYEGPTSGYKSSRDARYYVMLKVDSIDQVIRVNVTIPCWYALEVGERTNFQLNEFDMSDYGNGQKHLIK